MRIESAAGRCTIVPDTSAIDRVEVEYGEYEHGFERYSVWFSDGSKSAFDRSNSSFVRNGEPYHIFTYGLAFTEDGSLFLSGNWDKGLFAVNSRTGETIWHYSKSRIRAIFAFRDYGIALRFGYSLLKLDLFSGEVLCEIPGKAFESCWRLDERHIFLDRKFNSLCIVDAETMLIVEKIDASVFNPRNCLSCRIQEAWMQGNVIMIRGFEQYPNRDFSLPETENFIRAVGIIGV